MPPKKSSSDMSVKPRFGRPGNTLKMGIIGLPSNFFLYIYIYIYIYFFFFFINSFFFSYVMNIF